MSAGFIIVALVMVALVLGSLVCILKERLAELEDVFEMVIDRERRRNHYLATKVAHLEAATLPEVPWFDSLSARRERDEMTLNEMTEDVSWGGDAS